VHRELELPTDGRNTLTNSRIRAFQTCRRKHFYDFEMGIERIDEEERETLLMGSLWHKGLEAFWKTIKENSLTRETDSVQ
jgi:ATP-dependent helicase/DNAse subunit B